MQYSTTPGFKKASLSVSASQGLPDKLASALRGPDSFSPAKKESGKKDAAKGGGSPRPWNPPLHTASRLQPHTVPATKQICKCIRALTPGAQTACRFAVAYGVPWWIASSADDVATRDLQDLTVTVRATDIGGASFTLALSPSWQNSAKPIAWISATTTTATNWPYYLRQEGTNDRNSIRLPRHYL